MKARCKCTCSKIRFSKTPTLWPIATLLVCRICLTGSVNYICLRLIRVLMRNTAVFASPKLRLKIFTKELQVKTLMFSKCRALQRQANQISRMQVCPLKPAKARLLAADFREMKTKDILMAVSSQTITWTSKTPRCTWIFSIKEELLLTNNSSSTIWHRRAAQPTLASILVLPMDNNSKQLLLLYLLWAISNMVRQLRSKHLSFPVRSKWAFPIMTLSSIRLLDNSSPLQWTRVVMLPLPIQLLKFSLKPKRKIIISLILTSRWARHIRALSLLQAETTIPHQIACRQTNNMVKAIKELVWGSQLIVAGLHTKKLAAKTKQASIKLIDRIIEDCALPCESTLKSNNSTLR